MEEQFYAIALALALAGLSFGMTERVKKWLKVEKKAAKFGIATVMSAVTPLAVYFGGESFLEFFSSFLGDAVDIPTPPEGFPTGGYVLAFILNLFVSGGIYDERIVTGKLSPPK